MTKTKEAKEVPSPGDKGEPVAKGCHGRNCGTRCIKKGAFIHHFPKEMYIRRSHFITLSASLDTFLKFCTSPD